MPQRGKGKRRRGEEAHPSGKLWMIEKLRYVFPYSEHFVEIVYVTGPLLPWTSLNFIPASEETSVWQAVVFEFFIRTSFSNGLVLRSVKIGWTWIVYKRNYTVKYSHLDWPIIACKPSEIDDLINYWLMYDVKSDWLVILSKQWSPLLYLSW